MGRKNSAATKNAAVVLEELAELPPEVLNAPAIDPEVQREPRVLPDLTAETAVEEPKAEPADAIRMSLEDLEKAGCKNKSDAIRYLWSLGHKKSPIAKFLGLRYQHVNNVLAKELKRKVLPWTELPKTDEIDGVTDEVEQTGE